jgi:hypothetical protein
MVGLAPGELLAPPWSPERPELPPPQADKNGTPPRAAAPRPRLLRKRRRLISEPVMKHNSFVAAGVPQRVIGDDEKFLDRP